MSTCSVSCSYCKGLLKDLTQYVRKIPIPELFDIVNGTVSLTVVECSKDSYAHYLDTLRLCNLVAIDLYFPYYCLKSPLLSNIDFRGVAPVMDDIVAYYLQIGCVPALNFECFSQHANDISVDLMVRGIRDLQRYGDISGTVKDFIFSLPTYHQAHLSTLYYSYVKKWVDMRSVTWIGPVDRKKDFSLMDVYGTVPSYVSKTSLRGYYGICKSSRSNDDILATDNSSSIVSASTSVVNKNEEYGTMVHFARPVVDFPGFEDFFNTKVDAEVTEDDLLGCTSLLPQSDVPSHVGVYFFSNDGFVKGKYFTTVLEGEPVEVKASPDFAQYQLWLAKQSRWYRRCTEKSDTCRLHELYEEDDCGRRRKRDTKKLFTVMVNRMNWPMFRDRLEVIWKLCGVRDVAHGPRIVNKCCPIYILRRIPVVASLIQVGNVSLVYVNIPITGKILNCCGVRAIVYGQNVLMCCGGRKRMAKFFSLVRGLNGTATVIRWLADYNDVEVAYRGEQVIGLLGGI